MVQWTGKTRCASHPCHCKKSDGICAFLALACGLAVPILGFSISRKGRLANGVAGVPNRPSRSPEGTAVRANECNFGPFPRDSSSMPRCCPCALPRLCSFQGARHQKSLPAYFPSIRSPWLVDFPEELLHKKLFCAVSASYFHSYTSSRTFHHVQRNSPSFSPHGLFTDGCKPFVSTPVH